MKIQVASIIAIAITAGCAAYLAEDSTQKQFPAPGLPSSTGATELKNVVIPKSFSLQGLKPRSAEFRQAFEGAASANDVGPLVVDEPELTTIGQLKNIGMFDQSFHSADSPVVLVKGHGSFKRFLGEYDGRRVEKDCKTVAAIFDPNTKSLIAMSFIE